MPDYKYVAVTAAGKRTAGTATAPNPEQLKANLTGQKLFLLECDEVTSKKGKKLKPNELADFCRELGSMLGAGVSLVRAMNILIQRELPPKIKNAFVELNKQIKRGVSLSEAMVMQGEVFPDLLINMIRSGEASGKMDETCMKMADHYEKDHRLNGEIRGALTYPIILLVLTLLVIVGVFTFIFPRFMSLFEGMELPLITQIMLSISKIFTEQWFILIVAVVAFIVFILFLRQLESVRFMVDKIKVKLPKVGHLVKIIYTARFARTLSSLYSSGISIINSLQIARNTIGNRYVNKQFDTVIKDVKSGMALSAALMKVDGFDVKLAQTIIVGEETGQLDNLLIKVAEGFDYDSSMAIKKLIKIIEPLMICVMAMIIVMVMMGVMLPIFNMYGEIDKGA